MIRNLNYLVLALSVISLCCTSMKSLNTSSVDRNITMRDTFFLKKEIREGMFYHYIYIDSTKNPAILSPLYGFNESDSANLKDYLQAIRRKNIVLNKFNLYGLASEWLPVYRLNSNYYLYRPCDTGGKRHAMLTDSLIMLYYMDGYSPVAIKSVNKRADNIFNLKARHYVWQDSAGPIELNIYIIDKERMLTVWEYKLEDYDEYEYEYQLMIPKESVRHFSVIVNDSIEKQREVAFEKIDFKSLISGMK